MSWLLFVWRTDFLHSRTDAQALFSRENFYNKNQLRRWSEQCGMNWTQATQLTIMGMSQWEPVSNRMKQNIQSSRCKMILQQGTKSMKPIGRRTSIHTPTLSSATAGIKWVKRRRLKKNLVLITKILVYGPQMINQFLNVISIFFQ